MSLFGSSPEDSGLSIPSARSNQKDSLFDNEQSSNTKGGSSLFDDGAANGDSPWSMPTPKKASKSDLVKTLLPANDVPESYIDAFDTLVDSQPEAGVGKVQVSTAKKLFEDSDLNEAEQERILKLVTGGQNNALSRSEFNVLLALMGLSQEGEEASSLDSVDERRKSTCKKANRSC